jgi:hypothetical protein
LNKIYLMSIILQKTHRNSRQNCNVKHTLIHHQPTILILVKAQQSNHGQMQPSFGR